MSYNKRQLSKDTRAANKPRHKGNPFRKDMIYDPLGQWAHPGEVTVIPSGNITMRGVPYPVLGIDNFGNKKMMTPGKNYKFPGSIVTEYPMMQDGGDPEMLYRDQFNTPLTPEETRKFRKWIIAESKKQGRDVLMDMGAYDIQGFWKSGAWKNRDAQGHGTDVYKKPNHPTFSDESMYASDQYPAGFWMPDGGYYASHKTAELYSPDYYSWMFGLEPERPEHYKGQLMAPVVIRPQKQTGGTVSGSTSGGYQVKMKQPNTSEADIPGLVEENQYRRKILEQDIAAYIANGYRGLNPQQGYGSGRVKQDYTPETILSTVYGGAGLAKAGVALAKAVKPNYITPLINIGTHPKTVKRAMQGLNQTAQGLAGDLMLDQVYKQGGEFIEMELSDEEIRRYKSLGYRIEEL